MEKSKIVALAPLAGFTESAFRRLARELGADLTWTELTSANFILARGLEGPHFHIFPEERPLRFQLQGSETRLLVKAAEMVIKRLRPEGIDLNAGCPAKKVVKTGSGAALLKDLPKLYEISRALAELSHTYGCNFSVKFRLGFEKDELEKIAETLLKAGVDLLVLHARTAREGFSGRARWERIRDLVKLAGEEAFVFGSGDITSLSELERFFEETGASGALIGRAALSSPWIFKEWRDRRPFKPSLKERLSLLEKLAAYLGVYRGPEETLKVLKLFAPRLLKGVPGKRKILPLALRAERIPEFWAILYRLEEEADANNR